jgi:hypothetical protein
MRIGLLTCMWKRHELFRIYKRGIERLRKIHPIEVVIVGSEGWQSEKLCDGFFYVEHPNSPLGAKSNAGMKFMELLSPDYVIGMGSDDFMSDSLFRFILNRCDEGYDQIGFSDIWFYDKLNNVLGYWKGYTNYREGEPVGAGRVLSSRLLNLLAWQPRDEVERSLDYTITKKLENIEHKKYICSLKENNLFLVDVKTETNLCLYNPEILREDDINLLKQIPEL